jgi:hypothetical protein
VKDFKKEQPTPTETEQASIIHSLTSHSKSEEYINIYWDEEWRDEGDI